MQKVKAHILIIDDDPDVLHTARMVLKSQFSEITTESNPAQINYLISNEEVDVVLLDMNYTTGATSGKEGLFWLKEIKNRKPEQQVIMITAYGDIKLAVEAMKFGASDFVVKPWENEKLQATVYSAYQHHISKKEIEQLKSEKFSLTDLLNSTETKMIGDSPAMQNILKTIGKVAATEANILILGENGTGKELIAQAIHNNSGRKNNAMVKVDLGAIPENLFESELFGHKKGAFTDAKEDRKGKFAIADKGTLFLDEIGNIPLASQAKLLSALQNKRITPLGSEGNIDVDCRIIAATNSNLSEMISRKEFREDLLYRLNTVEIELPPLRKRTEDIESLALHYLDVYRKKYRKASLGIESETIDYLKSYHWPGNIRELQHAIERAVIMTDNSSLQPQDFLLNVKKGVGTKPDSYNLDQIEKATIEEALMKFDGNITKAAQELGLGRTTIYRKMEKYGIHH